MNYEDYTLAKIDMVNSRISDLKMCKNLNLFGTIVDTVATTGAFILSRNEPPHSLSRYALDVLVIFGISMFVLNAKDLCNNEKELKMLKKSPLSILR